MRLGTERHDREGFGYRYVYPVVSRRSQGLSIGINLLTNNACNWRCIYCQVEGLVRGAAPDVDPRRIETELSDLLEQVVNGSWLAEHVPPGSRRLNDIAFSGNGEPTSSPRFREVLEIVGSALGKLELLGKVKIVLITNGSLVHKPEVRAALERMRELGGEVWFKLDSATRAGRLVLNDASLSDERVEQNLALCARACPTRVQTIALALDGVPPSEAECQAYLDLLARAKERGVPLTDVLLYGLERASHQPEAPRLSKLPRAWLDAFARRIEAVGFAVRVHP
jgi:wyosine [tRNA(Phe)-imidazoG37] synthetase (radical SAM superfamily)